MSIALWCVLVAGLLPLLGTAFAKAGDIKHYDNNNPREWLAKRTGVAARGNAAQINSFEAFPFFAVAVLVATMLHAPQDRLDQLAIAFVAARLIYLIFYLADWATPRTLIWFAAMACNIAIFISAA